MVNRISPYTGQLLGVKGIRGESHYSKRDYTKREITRPVRIRRRRGSVGQDPLEMRAAGVEGSILERIVFKRLTVLYGPVNIGFIYKYQVGAVSGADARAFVGGFEMDFVVLNRPSGKEVALEILGAHWHGPKDQFADQERMLAIMGTGRDYAEIWEYEVMLGDEYLDHRIVQLVGESRASVDRTAQLERGVRGLPPSDVELILQT